MLTKKINNLNAFPFTGIKRQFSNILKRHSLYIFGDNSSGQLGIPGPNSAIPEKIPPFSKDQRIKQIVAGLTYSVALNEQRELFAWGTDDLDSLSSKMQKTPALLESYKELRIVKVSCGRAHSISLSGSGAVYATGSFELNQIGIPEEQRSFADREKSVVTVPHKINFDFPISDVIVGFDHSLAIAENGDVYSWGWNAFGQTGHNVEDTVPEPTRIQSLSGVKISKAFSISDYNILISKEGKLYSFGNGFHYNLGNGDRNMNKKPTLISSLSNKRFLSASCANTAAFAISEKKELFGWGNIKFQNYTETEPEFQKLPEIVPKLKDEKIELVVAGHRHVFCVNEKGRVFAWGSNDSGQLGIGDNRKREEPTVVEFFEGKKIVNIACGENHTIVQVEDS